MVAYAIDSATSIGKMRLVFALVPLWRISMNESWLAVCYAVAVQVFLLLMVVIIVDSTSWMMGLPSITSTIRQSWLSWPVGIMAAMIFGVVALGHFAPTNLPGK
jgi:hypothetical protein